MDSADVKAFFEEVSVDWDDMRSSFYNEGVIDALAERTQADRSDTIVDVGTGTGFVAAGLASRVARVIGVDSSPAMLAVARDNFDDLELHNIDVVQADTAALPLDDDSVDGAVANMVLHHAPEPVCMLQEMARVTRPGGWVAITDEVEHPYKWMRTEQADIWLGFTRAQIDTFFARARLVDHGYASLGMQ